MTPEQLRERLQKRNANKYPGMIDIESGWVKIIAALDEQLASLDPNYKIAQVKEKFGSLRFYLAAIDADVTERARFLIAEAEAESFRTCQICGMPGSEENDRGWYRTRCEVHTSLKE